MAECIDRDAALQDFEHCNDQSTYWTPQRVKTLLMRQSALEIPQVVRCRFCRSYNKPRLGWCEVHLDCENPDDFCGYGKYVTNAGG